MAEREKLDELDMRNALSGYLTEDDLAQIEDDGDMTTGEIYLLGTAFAQLGNRLIAAARETLVNRYRGVKGIEMEGRLAVTYIPAREQKRVDSKAVRTELSPEEHPYFYTISRQKETVKVTITNTTHK